ncbi:adaptor protein MecA [Butyrivibrio sp. CB08]|uniref:adaptor protein MecA n=1 Tax=Butyrivibrio sp. CB08 TaxID=2364879 RepID=UPI000EAABAB7|nr:adaptor protein MecA [Butyrivibrio sp. CB08]RKM62470.1 adaptor protein MecA [Butyrivibrio sp. CB08]
MEFKRINKDTVTCIITEDDMFEQGIKLEDLFEKKKEAMEFLHDVMKKAEEEVDYKPTGSFTPLQITVLPDHSVSLTLSENASASFNEILKNLTDKAGIKLPKQVLEDIGDTVDEERLNRLNEYLKSLKQITNSVKNMIEENDIIKNDSDKVSLNNNATVESAAKLSDKLTNKTSRKKEEAAKDKDLQRLKFHEYVFTFKDLQTVTRFCARVPGNVNIESSLYKNSADGLYYLDLKRKSEDPKVFASLFTMAYEFGHFQASNLYVISHIKENYDCLISGRAIEELSSLSMK